MQKILVISFLLLILASACNKKTQELSPSEEELIFKIMQYQLSNIDSSYVLANQLEKLAKEKHKELLTGFSNLLKTKYYYHYQKEDSAVNSLLRAYEIFVELDYPEGINMANNEILSVREHQYYKEVSFRELRKLPPKDSIFEKLLLFERTQYYISNLIYNGKRYEKADSVLKENEKIIRYCERVDSLADKYTKEVFYARHLLAKAYYLKGNIYGMNKDTLNMINFIKKSLYYDLLLHNRQAWSCFRLSEIYLELAKNDPSKKDFYLDSVRKYVNVEFTLLNLKNYKSKNYVELVDSLIRDSLYLFQLSKTIKVLANYKFFKGEKDLAFYLTNKALDLQFAGYVSYAEILIKQSIAIRKSEEIKNNWLTYLIFSLVILLIIILFFMIKYLKQRDVLIKQRLELDKRNKELEKIYAELDRRNKELEEIQKELKSNNDKLEEKKRQLEEEREFRTKFVMAYAHLIDNYITLNKKIDPERLRYIINVFRDLFNREKIIRNEKIFPYYLLEDIAKRLNIFNILNISDDVKYEYFYSDKYIVDLLLDNIITNAVKHNGEKENLKIRITCEKITEENIFRIKIVDNGKGMDKEAIKEFGILKEGKGVGLYLSKFFISRIGGNISAEKNETGGLTVCLNFVDKNIKKII